MKRNVVTALAAVVVMVIAAGACICGTDVLLPDKVQVEQGDIFRYKQGLLTVHTHEGALQQAAARQTSSKQGTFYLFDLIPVGKVRLEETERPKVALGGYTFGVKMFTDGVVVVGFGEVSTPSGSRCPATDAGLAQGDILLTVDGKRVTGNEDLGAIVSSSNGQALEVVYIRGEETCTTTLRPANAKDRSGFKAGMWVRDSCAGIGTVTYLDPETGLMAGLGHGVTDSDTGVVMPVGSGELVKVQVTGVRRGLPGEPGELKGVFLRSEELADVVFNGEAGVFGVLREPVLQTGLTECAFKQEVHTGRCRILCTVDDKGPRYYDAEIESVRLSDRQPTQNMVIRITDEELLEKTGGIVQGMSGSPIVQDGRLIGAVTHVFVGNPTRGYGIFVENMLDAAR